MKQVFKSEVISLHIMSLCRVASRGEIGEYFPPRFNPNLRKVKFSSGRVIRRVHFPVTEEYSNHFADPSSLRKHLGIFKKCLQYFEKQMNGHISTSSMQSEVSCSFVQIKLVLSKLLTIKTYVSLIF